jgi:hypothetical protein
MTRKSSAEKTVRVIRRATRKHILLKKIFVLHANGYVLGYVAQRVYLSYSVEKVSMRTLIIVGQKTFWKPARRVCQAMQCAKRLTMRSKTCVRRKSA